MKTFLEWYNDQDDIVKQEIRYVLYQQYIAHKGITIPELATAYQLLLHDLGTNVN